MDKTRLSRPNRGRKCYKESTESSDDEGGSKMKVSGPSDNEFRPSKKNEDSYSSQDDIPLKSLIKKAASKMSGKERVNNDRIDITIKSKSSLANICRPNLSEDDSSESSDDEDHVPLSRCKMKGLDGSNTKDANDGCKVIEKPSACINNKGILKSGNKNNEKSQTMKSESSDNERLSQSPKSTDISNISTVKVESEFVKSPPAGNESDAIEPMDEEKAKIKKRKIIEFVDKEVKAGGNKLPLSAKLSAQKKSLCLKKKTEVTNESLSLKKKTEVTNEVTLVSSGSDEVQEIKTTNKRKKKRKKEGKEIDDRRVSSSGKSKIKRSANETESPENEDEVKTNIRRRKIGKEEENIDQKTPLSGKRDKQINKPKNKSRKRTKETELTSSDECNGIWEDVNKVKMRKRKRRKEEEEASNKKSTLSGKLSVQKSRSRNMEKTSKESSDESESGDNWEDVDEVKTKTKKSKKKVKEEDECKDVGPIKDLEVSVEVDSIHMKKTKMSKKEKMFIWVRQMFHRIQKNTQVLLHKTHLLCLFARALNQNKCCSEDTLKAVCLSLIPNEHFQNTPKRWDISHLRRFLTWFQKDIPTLQDLLLYIDKEIGKLEKSMLERIHIFVVMMRSLGFLCRIIYSLQPVTGKVKKSELTYQDKPCCSTTPVTKKSQKKTNDLKKKLSSPESSYDDDPDLDFKNKKKIKTPAKTSKSKRKLNKNDMSSSILANLEGTCNIWAEIYMETLKRWICLELTNESINSPSKCEEVAAKPLQYVIGIDNNQKIKDVTCRYAEKWLTVNRKLRVDRDWWAETLNPYKPADDVINSSEDGQLNSELMRKDMPTTISAFKDHPLYALQRHLLKYEAIYPEGTVPIGYVGKNKEPVYPRDCIHGLHTQQTWLKEGRCLKPGEQPYKIVKGRKKFSEQHLEKETLQPCFGRWQTEKYVPPPVVDGKITKNEYGNVELFKPWMLPEGAIHIPMADVQRIAKKLDIDYAPAMMGWDFHGGFTHPVFEGIVVAKEYEDVVLDAWNKQEEERELKVKRKREETIYGNWKILIKGLLIRARLKDKYSFEEVHENDKTKSSNKIKTKKKAEKKTAVKCIEEENTAVKNNEEVTEGISSMSEYWPNNKQMDDTS